LIRMFVPLAVLTGGFAAGGLMITVLGGVPLLRALPTPREYVTVHKFLVTRFDPFMPSCLAIALISNFLLAYFAHTAADRSLALASAALFLGVLVISAVKNVPINKWIQTLDPDELPANWEKLDPRDRWGNWNAARTAAAVLAFLTDVVLIAALL
jgi:uncharacterized membrane protein